MQNINKQQGFGALLTIVVIGILLSTAAMGVIYTNSTAQQKHITSHAIVSAQIGAWKGIELFRIFLPNLTDEEISNLVGDFYIFTIKEDEYKIEIVKFDSRSRKIDINSIFNDPKSKSSAAVNATLKIKTKSGTGLINGTQAFIIGDVSSTGRIELDIKGSSKLVIEGDVTSQSINLTGVDYIFATGKVSFSSDEKIISIKSNDDVNLSGGTIVNKVSSLKNITATGGSAITTAIANGDIHYLTSGPSNSLSASGDIILAGGSNVTDGQDRSIIGLAHSNGDIYIKNKSTVNNVRVLGNVEIKNNLTTSRFIAEGDITCPYYSQIVVTNTIQTNKKIDESCNIGGSGNYLEDKNNVITPVLKLSKIIIDKPMIDVWKLK
ncbi:MAG: hypothetical protein HRU38_16115 [Saccharospirillaceae bacterium]|nr:hypothetical protein [Pseudomonadales bacterium]NRB80168.1 hypothetical protein [Saccharospirillaceae bacterium]